MLRFMIVFATSSSCEIGSKILTYSQLIKNERERGGALKDTILVTDATERLLPLWTFYLLLLW